MGEVHLATGVDGSRVALKFITTAAGDRRSEEDFRRRFAREAVALRRVDSMHVAMVLDCDPQGRPPWLAMQFVDVAHVAGAPDGTTLAANDEDQVLIWDADPG